jgi:hypothetical protein
MPPPGGGLKTATLLIPGTTMSPAETTVVKVALLRNVVLRLEPFNWMTEAGSKPAPLTVKVKEEAPAVVELGLRPASVGAGSETVNDWPAEVPPPGAGLKTVTLITPGATKSMAEMAAVRVLLLTNVVVRLEPFH